MLCNYPKGNEGNRMKDKGQVMFRLFAVMSIFIFVYFLADLSFSYLNVCQLIKDQVFCKPIPVIDLLPTI